MEESVSPPFHLKETYTLSRKGEGLNFSRVNKTRLFLSCVLSACWQGRVEAICFCMRHTGLGCAKVSLFSFKLFQKNTN